MVGIIIALMNRWFVSMFHVGADVPYFRKDHRMQAWSPLNIIADTKCWSVVSFPRSLFYFGHEYPDRDCLLPRAAIFLSIFVYLFLYISGDGPMKWVSRGAWFIDTEIQYRQTAVCSSFVWLMYWGFICRFKSPSFSINDGFGEASRGQLYPVHGRCLAVIVNVLQVYAIYGVFKPWRRLQDATIHSGAIFVSAVEFVSI